MQTLAIDIEIVSAVNLVREGLHKYVESETFRIVLFAYAKDDDPVELIDLASGQTLPAEIVAALEADEVTKVAFNAQFERVCLSKYLGKALHPRGWRCTAAQAASLGLPRSLDGVAQVLGLAEQKMKEGKGY